MRRTRKAIEKENNQLRQDNMTLKILTKAYMRKTAQQEDEIAALNASLDCTVAEMKRWQDIARKADERRLAYVRDLVSAD